MPESEIENCIDGYEGEFASVFESAGRSVEHARAELAALRAQAARAIDGEEMAALLAESKRRHYTCEDNWYSCAAATGDDECADDNRRGKPCDCGADKWNARVDAVLNRRAAIVQALERREG